MTGVHGQASVEYAGLLALAAVLGATLALIAGPPLVHAVRNALTAVLTSHAHRTAPAIASAADVADVESALRPGDEALTPDAALLALERRHGGVRAREVAEAHVLSAARAAVPWLGGPRTYHAWERPADGPYGLADSEQGDHDVETPTGVPVARWITVAAQRRAVAAAFAHHTSAGAVVVDAASIVPVAGWAATAAKIGLRSTAGGVLTRVPDAIGTARTGSAVAGLAGPGHGDVPAGMRIGDVVVSWPVHRTYWRDGRPDPQPSLDIGARTLPLAQDYVHTVVLRPGAGGLVVVAERLDL